MGLTSAHGCARRAKPDSRRGDAFNAPSCRQERARSGVIVTMTSLRCNAAVTLSVGSLAAILGGCGSSYCPPSGECVAIPSDSPLIRLATMATNSGATRKRCQRRA